MANELQISALERLTPEERLMYDTYVVSGKPLLSLDTSLRLFELFVQGTQCSEIARLNPGFSQGMVLRARVEHLWDARRDSHLSELYTHTSERLRQIAMESVNFLGDLLAATHKLHGDKLKRFIQTGDDSALEGMEVGSIKQYKDVIETLGKITGSDNKKTIKHEGNVGVVAKPGLISEKMSPERADLLRALLEKGS